MSANFYIILSNLTQQIQTKSCFSQKIFICQQHFRLLDLTHAQSVVFLVSCFSFKILQEIETLTQFDAFFNHQVTNLILGTFSEPHRLVFWGKNPKKVTVTWAQNAHMRTHLTGAILVEQLKKEESLKQENQLNIRKT